MKVLSEESNNRYPSVGACWWKGIHTGNFSILPSREQKERVVTEQGKTLRGFIKVQQSSPNLGPRFAMLNYRERYRDSLLGHCDTLGRITKPNATRRPLGLSPPFPNCPWGSCSSLAIPANSMQWWAGVAPWSHPSFECFPPTKMCRPSSLLLHLLAIVAADAVATKTMTTTATATS